MVSSLLQLIIDKHYIYQPKGQYVDTFLLIINPGPTNDPDFTAGLGGLV